MSFTNLKYTKMVGILGMATFIIVAIIGVSYTLEMKMKSDGTMSGCLFDGQAETCPMTIAEHLSRWQGMFTVIPQKTDILIQFLLLALAVIFIASAFRQRLLLLLSAHFLDRWRLYLKQNPHIPLFDPLREAFSRGILNPKIYESAIL